MNIFLTTDGYHLTMGFLINEGALKSETHILYARTGGPLVVPDLAEMVKEYIEWRPTIRDVEEAYQFWISQGVPFNKDAAEEIVKLTSMPITVRGVKAGEVVLPGEPIAVIKAPAFLAAIPEPVFIANMMTSIQVATRFTKVAQALNWERERVFEVGMRADKVEEHIKKIKTLAGVGLKMTSSGIAAKEAGIKAGGSMGHRFTQRFSSDYDAFIQALEQMLWFKDSEQIKEKVKLSFLLDTRNTLLSGLPAALAVIEERYDDIVANVDLSVRLDSGDLAYQLEVIIDQFLNQFDGSVFMPSIILESGLNPRDIASFEAIAKRKGFPLNKMLYGVGGYLVSGVKRDDVSMVYKVSSYDDGIATMKFGDEDNRGKESYPGEISLMERQTTKGIERQLALISEVESLKAQGWKDLFETICLDGVMQITIASKQERIARLTERWKMVAKGYIGDKKRPENFTLRPQYSHRLEASVQWIRELQLVSLNEIKMSNY